MNRTKPDRPPFRVLFLCTANSCRSQMAEGWARHLLGNRVDASSAGTEPKRVDPRAIQVMKEVGVDISSHRAKPLDAFLDQAFDLTITLCDNAQAHCPAFLGEARKIHVGFPDPAQALGSEKAVLNVYREVRDRIRKELIPLLEAEIVNPKARSG